MSAGLLLMVLMSPEVPLAIMANASMPPPGMLRFITPLWSAPIE